MYSGRTDRLGGFPWDGFHGRGFWAAWESLWVRMQLENQIPFPRDIVLDSDFPRGNADKYRVIIDGGTVIMETRWSSRIEQWVREGGMFVAYGQTGRHTPEVKDAWPLARLSGYRIVTDSGATDKISAAAEQKSLSAAWSETGQRRRHGPWSRRPPIVSRC